MLAVLSSKTPLAAMDGLRNEGFDILPLPPNPTLPKPVSAHPDLSVFFAPDGILCTSSYYKLAKKELDTLSQYAKKPILCIEEETSDTYPGDILLNAAPVGRRLFCLPEHTAHKLTAFYGYKLCRVKQGYAKCSTVPLGARALMTEDPSIASVAEAEGLSVLRLTQNQVALPGYSTGFLGGASSFAPYKSVKTVYFCGNIESHADADKICRFCHTQGYEIRSLSTEPLFDVGTMFLI